LNGLIVVLAAVDRKVETMAMMESTAIASLNRAKMVRMFEC
jgi:hypothetical protein